MASTDPALSDASSAALIPLGSHSNSAPIDLKRPIFIIGARKDIVRLHLQSSTVSKAHCVIVVNSWGCYVHDLGSRTGTIVNGQPIQDQDLADGDVLQVGRFQFKYRAAKKLKAKPQRLPPADLTVSSLTEPLLVHRRVIAIGRRVGSDVQFDDSRVSNLHALIVEQEGRRLVRDLTSRTGTWLDEKPIHQEPLADGAPLRVGGATLTIADHIEPAVRADDAPLTLADAPAGLAVAEALELADLDLSKLSAPDDTIPAADDDSDDALAALRRGWQAPLPIDEALPMAPVKVEPEAPEAPAAEEVTPPPIAPPTIAESIGTPAPEPVEELELEPLDEIAVEAPPIEEPKTDTAKASEAAAALAAPVFEPTEDVAGPVVADVAPLDELVADIEPVEEIDDFDVGAEADEPIDIEALALEALELDADAPKVEAKTPAAEAEVVLVEESSADVITDVKPSADAVVGDAQTDAMPSVMAEIEADSVGEEAADIEALELDPDAPKAGDGQPLPVEALDFAPEIVAADETAPLEAAAEILEPETAEATEASKAAVVADLGLDDEEAIKPLPELSLDDLSLLKDPDAPVADAPADVDALSLDADAPPVTGETKLPEIAVISVETSDRHQPSDMSDNVSEVPAAAEADLVDLSIDEPDESGAKIVSDVIPPTAAAAETVATAPTDFGGETLPLADDIGDLLSEWDAPVFENDEAESVTAEVPKPNLLPEAPLAGAASLPSSVADDETPDLAEILAEAPVTPAAPVPSAFAEPELPPAGPDLVNLDEDADEDANDATALAVDLGLVLDDDHVQDSHDIPEFTAAAPPAEPVEIDLANATPVSRDDRETASVDLSHIGPIDDDAFSPHAVSDVSDAPLTLPAAGQAASADIFDVDDIELIEPDAPIRPPIAEAPAPIAKAKDEDDHISPPEGGTLADLIPGGPPLLGGSFMSLPPMMPPLGAPEGKRRPLRVGFGGEARPARTPFAADRTIADAVGGPTSDDEIDGLIAGASSIDAFSGAAMPASSPLARTEADVDFALDDEEIDLVDTQRTEMPAPAAEAPLATSEVFRPRGTIRPVVAIGRLETDETRVTAVTPADVDFARVKRHKKRVRRVIACLIGMVVLIGGAAWGVYYFTPLRSTVDALISFQNLDQLSPEQVAKFRASQNDLLVSEQVRQAAVQNLKQSIPAGFLSDGTHTSEAIDRDPKVRWPADRPTVMRLHVRSDDKENDLERLRVLATSLVDASSDTQTKKTKLITLLAQDTALNGDLKAKSNFLNEQLQALRQAAAGRPELKNLSDLNAEFLAAEPALTAIKSKRQELEATVERLSKPVSAQPNTPAVDPATADQELTQLTAQLSKLQQPVTPPENTADGAEARKRLDESIASLEKDLATAQKQQGSPELAGYVEAANRAFTEYKGLIDIYIRSQENQRTRLTELKAKLSDRMQARAQDLIAKDSELKKLKDDLDILTRQYNAASASPGFEDNAKKSELELRLLKVKVAEREDQLNNDTVSSEVVTGLQGVIDGIEKDLRDSRKQLDEKVTTMQASLMKSAPTVQSLPAEQKQLAEGIEGKMAAVNEARRAYNDAAEKAQAEQAKAEAASAEQTAALRLKIAARRQDVLAAAQAKQAENDEATRKRMLGTAQTDLASIRQQEQSAANRVAAASAAIEANEKQRRIEAQANADMQSKKADLDIVSRQSQEANATLNRHAAERASLIVPDPKPEMNSFDDKDRRPLFAAGAGLGIVLLLGIPMLMDLLALAREAHHPVMNGASVHSADDGAKGFEPIVVQDTPRKALPEPAHV